ncbi:MAG: hypothetical protein ACLFSC_05265 [Wenzhouxiangella sp.]
MIRGREVRAIRAICRATHAAACGAMGALTVIIPLAGLILGLALFALGL